MADTRKVKALRYHTLHGEEHAEGDTYDADAADVANLVGQGLVSAVDAAAPAKARASKPVEPMTTENFGKAKK